MYIQGTTKRLAYIDKRVKPKPAWYILMPRYRLTKLWSGVEHSLLIYTAIYVPFQVAYLTEESDQSPFLNSVDDVVDVLFIMALFITFITAFDKQNGTEEFRLSHIALNYLRTWLLVDILACFPFGLILPFLMPKGGGSGSQAAS